MKLTPEGINWLNNYIAEVKKLKNLIIVEQLKVNEAEAERALAIRQCDAAIAIATDFLNQSPRTEYGFFWNGKLVLSLAGSLKNGSYASNYAILNGNSGAWAVGISNRHNAQLAYLIRALTADLQQNLETYFAFERDPETQTIQLGIGIASSSTSPETILASALLQMDAAITFWNSYTSLSEQSVRTQIRLMVNILNPHLLEDALKPVKGIEPNAHGIGLAIGLTTIAERDELQSLVSDIRKAKSKDEKPEIEAKLKVLLISSLENNIKVNPIVLPKLEGLYQLILEINKTQDPSAKANLEEQCGQMLGNLNAYYIRRGYIDKQQFIHLNELARQGSLSCGDTHDNPQITAFCDHSLTDSLGSILAYNENIRAGFISSLRPEFLNARFTQLINKLDNKIQLYKTKSTNAEKIKILQNLLFDLKTTQETHYDDQKKLITNMLSIIDCHNEAHNAYVLAKSKTLARAGEILQDTLTEALEIFETHTLSCDTVATKALLAKCPEVPAISSADASSSAPVTENTDAGSGSPSSVVGHRNSFLLETNASVVGSADASSPANSAASCSSGSAAGHRNSFLSEISGQTNEKEKKEKENIVKGSTP